MPLHNPRNLNSYQYGAHLDYRLLDEDEVENAHEYAILRDIECFILEYWDNNGWRGSGLAATYRTKLTKEDLLRKRMVKQKSYLGKKEKGHKLTKIFV